MTTGATDKKQISLIVGIVLSALIALAAVFGYDVTVVAPREQAANALSEQIVLDQAQQATLDLLGQAGGSRAVGDTNFTNLVASGDLTVGGAVAVTGAVTAASFTSQSLTTAGNIAADTGTYTTSLIAGAFTANTGTYTTSVSAGALTATSAAIGGGFGATGCTLSSAGVIQCDGAMTIGGAAVITGATTFQGAMNVNANGDFDSVSIAGNLDLTTVNNTGANPVTVNDNLVITGTVAVNGAATVTGTLTANTFLVLTKAGDVTVTDGSIITPTASYQPITAGAAVGTDLIAVLSSGTLLRLVNVGSNTITITDTGTLKLAGNIALGQYDSLLLLSDGTNWVQMGTSDN